MNRTTDNTHRSSARRAIGTSAFLALWSAFYLLLAFPALHHLVHHDSAQAGHVCFITEFSSTSEDLMQTASVLPSPVSEYALPGALKVSEPTLALRWNPCAARPPPVLLVPSSFTGSARV